MFSGVDDICIYILAKIPPCMRKVQEGVLLKALQVM